MRNFNGFILKMPRYTTAYSSLLVRLDEVELLLKMARKMERSDAVSNFSRINALCRSSAVLLCSHLEGYVKELGELTLTRIHSSKICRSKVSNLVSYYASYDIISEIKDTADGARLAGKLIEFIERDQSLWAQSGPYSEPISEERFNKSFASPSYDKVSAYIGRFGYSTFKRDLGRLLKADFLASKNMVDHVVDTRNKIAHGDLTVSKTPGDLLEAVLLVKKFCRATDTIFASWCQQNLCAIR